MKNFLTIKSKQKGFTLIELLVVIAIISLLSSVVLASVKESREKAKMSKFRQEVQQFIIAIEMYKGDKGYYPGESNDCQQHWFTVWTQPSGVASVYLPPVYINCTTYNQYGIRADMKSIDITAELVPKYLSKIPSSPIRDSNFMFDTGGVERCVGDTSFPPYTILVDSTELLAAFKDWPYMSRGDAVTPDTTQRCFSLK